MEVRQHEVEFTDVIEELLQTPIFHDKHRTDLLYDQPELLDPADLGARREVGSMALRLIAAERSQQRVIARHFDPNFDIRSWNKQQHLTKKYLGDIAHIHQDEVNFLARQMAIINMAEKALAPNRFAELCEGLRAKQPQYLRDCLRFIVLGPQKGRLPSHEGYDDQETFLRGTTVIAPTGYGKTEIMGRIVKALGSGSPIEGVKNDERPVRILVIEPYQSLVNQMGSTAGDMTFERSSGLKPGRYFEEEKNELPVVVSITIRKFLEDFRDGKLKDEVFDILMIDEAHTLTGRVFPRFLINHWRGPVYGFTATPNYDKNRDVRKILCHVIQHDDLLTSTENGPLNGAQLFTFVVDPQNKHESKRALRDAADKKLLEFLMPLLAEGRRGMIFCEHGNRSLHARTVANELSKLNRPDGCKITAKAIGCYIHDSNQIIDDYHAGKIDILTTTMMGTMGFNADIDFVIINREVGSLLWLTQMLGRGTRPSELFPHTVYGQVLRMSTVFPGRVSIYNAFGLEKIEQGITIGWPNGSQGGIKIKDFSDEFQTTLAAVNHRPVGEVLISNNLSLEIPEGYRPLNKIIEGTMISKDRARRLLINFDWIGHREKGKSGMTRYYEPAAEAYLQSLKDRPIYSNLPPGKNVLIEGTESANFAAEHISTTELAKKYGLGWHRTKKLVEKSGVLIVHKHYQGLTATYMRKEDLATFNALVDKEVPIAKAGAVTIDDILLDCGLLITIPNRKNARKMAARRNINAQLCRLPQGGIDWIYNKDDANIIRQLLNRR